jgi:phospholipase/carboxylesterase
MDDRRHAPVGRRRFGAIAGASLASLALARSCPDTSQESTGADGRIDARPRPGSLTSSLRGGALRLGGDRDAILQLPDQAASGPRPLLVLFHGAGGSGAGVLRRLGAAAAGAGLAVLAPDSRDSTWDAIGGNLGPDVTFINRALERVFDSGAIDAARVTVGGFSDGATYALSLGLLNGDLFKRVAAFSPGFLVDGKPQGKPDVFISHGTADPILPIDRCSRRIVATLRSRGYTVAFREFRGGHEIPPDIARDAMAWLAVRRDDQ